MNKKVIILLSLIVFPLSNISGNKSKDNYNQIMKINKKESKKFQKKKMLNKETSNNESNNKIINSLKKVGPYLPAPVTGIITYALSNNKQDSKDLQSAKQQLKQKELSIKSKDQELNQLKQAKEAKQDILIPITQVEDKTTKELENKIAQIQKKANQNNQTKKELQDIIKKLGDELNNLKTQYEQQLNTLRSNNSQLTTNVNNERNNLQLKINELESAQSQIANLTNDKADLNKQIETFSQISATVDKLKAEISDRNNSISSLSSELLSIKDILKAAEEKINEMTKYYDIARAQEVKYKSNMKLTSGSYYVLKTFIMLFKKMTSDPSQSNSQVQDKINTMKNLIEKITFEDAQEKANISYENFFEILDVYFKIIVEVNDQQQSDNKLSYIKDSEYNGEYQLVTTSLQLKQLIFEDYNYNRIILKCLGLHSTLDSGKLNFCNEYVFNLKEDIQQKAGLEKDIKEFKDIFAKTIGSFNRDLNRFPLFQEYDIIQILQIEIFQNPSLHDLLKKQIENISSKILFSTSIDKKYKEDFISKLNPLIKKSINKSETFLSYDNKENIKNAFNLENMVYIWEDDFKGMTIAEEAIWTTLKKHSYKATLLYNNHYRLFDFFNSIKKEA